MNKIMFVLFAVLIAFSASAQSQGTWAVGVGGDVAVPIGDFSNFSKVGIGGTAWAGYLVDENLSITGKVGVLSFSGKDFTASYTLLGVTTSTTVTGASTTIIPILVGARYFFMPPADMRVYGSADVGMYNIGNGGGTKVGFAPSLGAQFKAGDNMNVDVRANYTTITTEGSSSSWVGVGIGLEFGLK